MARVLLSLAHMSGAERDFVKEAFDTNWVVPLGPNVNGFENDLEQWLNQKSDHENHVVALSAGTAAIHSGLVMLGVEKGDVIKAGWEGKVSIYNKLFEVVPCFKKMMEHLFFVRLLQKIGMIMLMNF